MNLSIEELKAFKPCQGGLEYWIKNNFQTVEEAVNKVLFDESVIPYNRKNYAIWLLYHVMNPEQREKFWDIVEKNDGLPDTDPMSYWFNTNAITPEAIILKGLNEILTSE